MGMEPVGLIGSKLYVKAAGKNDMDDHIIVEKDLREGTVRELAFPDMWGDFSMTHMRDRLYYLGGRTDVSTSLSTREKPMVLQTNPAIPRFSVNH